MEVYRRLARIRDVRRMDDFRQELRDRYGPLPEATEWLLRIGELRLLATRWQIASLHRDGVHIVLSYRNATKIEQLAATSHHRLKVVDGKAAYFRLQPEEDEPRILYPLLKKLFQGGN